MAQTPLSRCDCCGQGVDLAQFEFCPTCQYPVSHAQEQHFLEVAISDLQRVARYGGSSLRVADLIRRYEGRQQFLSTLHPLQTTLLAISSQAPASARTPVDLATTTVSGPPEQGL